LWSRGTALHYTLLLLLLLLLPQAFINFAKAQGLASPADLLTAPGNASLMQVLAYHVVPGVALQQRDLTNGAMLPTMLEGQQLSVSLQ
jgi:hypothetical protein